MEITLGKFDTLYWLEGCARGSHLRKDSWNRMIDKWKDCTESERDFFYKYSKRDIADIFKESEIGGKPFRHFGAEDFYKYLACYNPANRYKVTASNGEVSETTECFLFEGSYWIDSRHCVAEEFIKNVEHLAYTKGRNNFCELREKCLRSCEDASDSNIYQWSPGLGCENFISEQ